MTDQNAPNIEVNNRIEPARSEMFLSTNDRPGMKKAFSDFEVAHRAPGSGTSFISKITSFKKNIADRRGSLKSSAAESDSLDIQRAIADSRELKKKNKKKGKQPKHKEFANEYLILNTLGRSQQAKVKLCKKISDSQFYAVKIMKKRMLEKKKLSATGASVLDEIQHGIALMKKLYHPNLIALYEVIDDPISDKLFLVMEYANKGAIFPNSEEMHPLDPETARRYMRDIVCGLEYLHLNHVIHRDLKPENILICATPDGKDVAKIGDFGLATMYDFSSIDMTSSAGTPAFQSPELCAGMKVHGRSSDVWALGVTFYTFIFGKYPFWAKNVIELSEKIQHDELVLPTDIDPQIEDILKKMMCKDLTKRMTLAELKQHPWITNQGKEPMPELDPKTSIVGLTEEEQTKAMRVINKAIRAVQKLVSSSSSYPSKQSDASSEDFASQRKPSLRSTSPPAIDSSSSDDEDEEVDVEEF